MSTPNCDSEVRYELLLDAPGYLVGSDGSIWSCRKNFSPGRMELKADWTQRKLNPNRDGYLLCVVKDIFNPGRVKQLYPHRLVLIHFCRQPVDGEEVCHNDGDKTNNRIENLRWGSRDENMKDTIKHGVSTQKHRMRRISPDEAVQIRLMRASGLKIREIAERVGASTSRVASCIKRRSFAKVA